MPKTFHQLDVWNHLTTQIYEFTADFPRQEIYGLTSQMRRAAVSVPSNIAEGSAWGTRKDFRQFVKLAEGSNCELQTQLIIAKHLRFGDSAKLDAAEMRSIEVGKMLGGLSAYLTREMQTRPLIPAHAH